MGTLLNRLGDTRVAFVLLMMASATLFIGALYAGGDYSLFMTLNRLRVHEWLAMQVGQRPGSIWWIPLLFVIMGALGLNAAICAGNRLTRLVRQRHGLGGGRFFHLLSPTLIHFLFIVLMLGHLTTFTTARWQRVPLEVDSRIISDQGRPAFQVETIVDHYYPETSALRGRIAQTAVTLADPEGQRTRLEFGRPVFVDGRFFFLDRVKPDRPANRERVLPATTGETKETCNQERHFREKNPARQEGQLLLLTVSDPGLIVILAGLSLIMGLMLVYYLTPARPNGSTNRLPDAGSKDLET